METLNAMEKIEVDNKDKPIEDIVIQKAQVFVDPFQEADEMLAADRAAEAVKAAQEAKELSSGSKKDGDDGLKVYRPGVAKYLKPSSSLE